MSATFLTDGNGLPYEFFLNLPFGETMAEQHSQTADYENRWKFTGHELDRETGLYYAGARYYDPKVSIWLSVDPLAEKYSNWNPYNYVMQNPVNLTDPTGMCPDESEIGDPPNKYKEFFKRALNNTTEFLKDTGKVVDKALQNLSPIYIPSEEEQLLKKEQYGEGVLADLNKMMDDIKNLPEKFKELADIDFNSIKEKFINSTGEEKAEFTLTLSTALLALKKGNTKGLVMLGGNKFIFIGGIKLVTETFHKTIKPNILKNAGDFSKTVGKNPNINIKSGNIILEGQGPFKGKTFTTSLKANDYLR